MNIAFLYEHPQWSGQLLDCFEGRGVELARVNVADLAFDTSRAPEFDAAINRINIMPSAERDPRVVFQVMHYLKWLEIAGIRVINGSTAHNIGSSKVMQNGVFSNLGLRHPRGIAIYRLSDALEAAAQIGYPVIVKPNIGGSGSGVALFEKKAELEQVVANRSLDLGIDRTGLVQQYINTDGYVYRVEMLGDELFYSIRQQIQQGSFNYCAADGCSTDSPQEEEAGTKETGVEEVDSEEGFDFCAIDGGDRIGVFEPSPAIIDSVAAVLRQCQADLGGVEYFIEQDSGEPVFYDFNPYSNFVSNGPELLGFSPENRYIDFVMGRLAG
jgi:hypothetical protein